MAPSTVPPLQMMHFPALYWLLQHMRVDLAWNHPPSTTTTSQSTAQVLPWNTSLKRCDWPLSYNAKSVFCAAVCDECEEPKVGRLWWNKGEICIWLLTGEQRKVKHEIQKETENFNHRNRTWKRNTRQEYWSWEIRGEGELRLWQKTIKTWKWRQLRRMRQNHSRWEKGSKTESKAQGTTHKTKHEVRSEETQMTKVTGNSEQNLTQ